MIASLLMLSLCIAPSPRPSSASPQEPEAERAHAGPPVITIDGDEHKRYVLHAPAADVAAPKDGWKVLVVMPGGDGSADFAPFVGRIRENALPDADEWIAVQLIAPVWDEKQAETLVWPTKEHPWRKMKFACEELFADALADVAKTRKLDPAHLFTLAWSSSGQLAYTLALDKKSPVTGTFVAMSVFKPNQLPKLKGAKGRRFHILHSPDDFIPIAMAEKARDELTEHGAHVTFATYDGGHGWHGDVFGNLRAGFASLAGTEPGDER